MAGDRGISLSKQSFEQLFRAEIGRLHNFARQYVDDSDAAMDICQNVFILLWEKRETLDPGRAIKSYLYTSVKNRCLNYLRDNKKYRSKVLDLDCVEAESVPFEENNLHPEELEQKITLAIEALPEKCREVFEMSRFREMKYREIAEELSISQKTVEAHMSKAIRMLRDTLGHLLLLLWVIWHFLQNRG